VIELPLGPEARYEQTESISLAFVTALQVLPPRQLAVLILRDVLGFHANEVANMMDSTVESVNSALKRARASLQRRRPESADREPPPPSDSAVEDAIVAKFVGAWESADLDGLVALLTDDAFISMPPMPFEYEGRDLVAGFCANIFGAGRRFELVRTRANGQPAFGAYLLTPTGISHGVGLYVLTLAGARIGAMTRLKTACSHGSGYRDHCGADSLERVRRWPRFCHSERTPGKPYLAIREGLPTIQQLSRYKRFRVAFRQNHPFAQKTFRQLD